LYGKVVGIFYQPAVITNHIRYLDSLASKEYIAQKPGLGRIRKLLECIGDPQDKYPVIHIAGTNGKGSTATAIYEILRQAGYRVGLYTSPHLVCYRERIRIGDARDRLISAGEVSKLLKAASSADEQLFKELTYFEVLTAVAFMYFAQAKVDFVVCETGLGGKYDATNIISSPVVSLITSIDFDHMEYLGRSLDGIAREKSGIIKKNVPVIVNLERSSLKKIVSDKCRRQRCKMFSLGKDFCFEYINTDWDKLEQRFSYRGINRAYEDLSVRLLGRHQLSNVSLALACIELLMSGRFIKIPDGAVRCALKRIHWPGRFEIIKSHPVIILDGAHNSNGSAALKNTLSECPFIRNRCLVIAMSVLKGKEYKKICKALAPVAKKVVVFKADTARALEPEILMNEWKKYLSSRNIMAADGFNQVLKKVKKTDTVCVTGSFYAVGDAIKYFT
jgi:dihydrofolate synthase/folylpolyglutamate synthase